MSDSLQPQRLQHARLPCPSPTSGACSNSCPLSRWCQPTISSSVIPFSCLQSFPASGPFQMSQLFASGGQRIGVAASASVLPMNIQGLISFRTDWLEFLAAQGTLKSLLQHHSLKALILQHSAFFTVQLSHSVQISHSVGSASASVLPMNIQDWFPLGWTGWISLQFKGLSRVFSNTTVQKHQFFGIRISL